MNHIQLIGYLGQDPQITTDKHGGLMARLRLATDNYFHPKNGEPKKYTDWHTVRIWNQDQIEKLRNYLIRGSHVLMDGRVVYRSFTDKEGRTRYATEIRANYLVDLDR